MVIENVGTVCDEVMRAGVTW